MTDGFQPNLDFVAAQAAADDGEALIIDLDGYEGPLHVLLALARSQKVDLLKLSVTRLAEQYLAFVHRVRTLRFSLAADYLVMAAWLAYLKSRLLLPSADKPRGDEPPAEEIAASLAFRLAKLDAMRKASDALQTRPRLGRDVFTRGDPEQVRIVGADRFEGDLYQLISAYISQRRQEQFRTYRPEVPQAFALEDARRRLRELLPEMGRWTPLAGLAPVPHGASEPTRASYLASTLSASLELVKEGALDARQMEAFAEIYLKARLVEPEGAPT